LEIDLQGAHQVRQRRPDATIVLVVAPSVEEQEARLVRRGDDEAHVGERLRLGRAEEREGRSLADHVVVNDEMERALGELQRIVETVRATRAERGDGGQPPATASRAQRTGS
jgi:guanylate kinase